MPPGSERAGLADLRAEVLAGVGGRTLEIGGGTGLNLARYPAGLDSLTITALRSGGFDLEVEPDVFPKAGPLVRPLVRGSATPAV